jgi:hypothetical protein
MAGSLVYMLMLLNRYGKDINTGDVKQGFANELNKAVKQHKK